ncbi:MAG: electron transfer flavoprotein subunit beta, partial [Solirubrobacterales bacterium]|nr:electron transfer flavoprotein subunit beta [Solirubrobacterales bacterium]
SSDAVNGATGVAVAAYLGLPHVAVVRRLDYDASGPTATVERELEGGLIEVLRVRCPALLTIQTGMNEPRYATLRAIKQARDKPLEEVDLDALGLDADAVAGAAGSQIRSLAPPEKGRGAEMLSGSPAEVAARIADIVKERVSA